MPPLQHEAKVGSFFQKRKSEKNAPDGNSTTCLASSLPLKIIASHG
jgi:hypothetical protein